MKDARSLWLAALGGCILIISITSGCSAIGYGTGMAIDDSRSDTKTIIGRECHSMETGTDVEIHMKGGFSCRGTFTGLDPGNSIERKYLDDLPVQDSMQLKTFMIINGVDSISGNTKTRNGPNSYLGWSGGIVPRYNLKRISFRDIDSIEVRRKKCATWIGLGVRAAVDAAIIIAGIAISTSSFGGFGG